LDPTKVLDNKDATASFFQLKGCLLKDEKMLEFSNFFENKERLCVYTYIQKQFEEKLKPVIADLKAKYETIYVSLNEDIKARTPTEVEYRLNNIERSFIKSRIMTHSYNQGVRECCKVISDYFFGTTIFTLYPLTI